MSSLPSPPSPPPGPAPHHVQFQQTRTHLNKKPITAIPDFIFTAFSLFFLFSSPKSTATFTVIPKITFPLNPRRFFRIPIMSLPIIPASKTTTNSFPSPQSLSDWLKPRLPSDSFASWGVKPGTKNVQNLWLELSEGETLLADSIPPIRNVEVVVVRVIGKDNKLLLESHQQLSNGDVRNRSRPLSEKMKPSESVEAAAFRAVKEELGSIIDGGFNESSGIVTIVPNSYSKKVEEGISASYPGLPARYVLHTLDALVEGLPEGDFWTEEAEEYEDSDGKRVAHGAVSCKKHYWKWVDSYEGLKI